MTNRRGPFTTNLVKRGSREEAERLLQMLPDSPDSLAEVSEAPLVAVARSREDRLLSPRPASGVGSVDPDSTQRTRTRSSSEHFNNSGRVTEGSNTS